MRWLGFGIVAGCALAALPIGAAAQEAGAVPAATTTVDTVSMSPWFVYGIPVVAIVVALYYVRKILQAVGKDESWSIAKALSEKATTVTPATAAVTAQTGTGLTVPGSPSSPGQSVEYEPSSSRLIAFMGTIIILIIFSGFGLVAMVRFALGEKTTGLEGASTYLLAGMSFFAPYAFNKTAEVLKSFSGKP